jgi:hypothetical protein
MPSDTVWRGLDLIEDDTMKKLHVAINTTYGFICCTESDCGFALVADWHLHLQRSHETKVSNPDKDAVNEQLRALQNTLPFPEQQDAIAPVSGLLLHHGEICDLCNTFLGSKSSLASHFSVHHRGQEKATTPAWGQRRTLNTKFFVVRVSSCSATVSSWLNTFIDTS